MTKLQTLVMPVGVFIVFLGACHFETFAQERMRPFKVSFEIDGKKVKTDITVRIKRNNKIIDAKIVDDVIAGLPDIEKNEIVDLWIMAGGYKLSFPKMPGWWFNAPDWRVGVDERPFKLEYAEIPTAFKGCKAIFYLIYKDPNGGDTPIVNCAHSGLKGLERR